ncbi:hypothetical protein WMY93_031355 [Mugilogobius chulae]|uniref:Uncharacterized protein n=1 Tax=Mugilogobius chulae TaxID=88201 RepID=A0AAW0MG47_9GOBI
MNKMGRNFELRSSPGERLETTTERGCGGGAAVEEAQLWRRRSCGGGGAVEERSCGGGGAVEEAQLCAVGSARQKV